MASASRGSFSSRIGFVAAAAGSAVGLGNIWKFPYEVGANGGAAFLVVYVLCAFLICMPIMVAEIAMGRNTRLNPYGAYTKLGSRGWGLAGLLGILAGIMILSFYNVVAGWAFGYFLQIGFGDLLQQPGKEEMLASFLTANPDLSASDFSYYGQFFGGYIADIWDNLFYSLAFMVLTALIVVGGVQKGIERWTKILMPALVGIIVLLIAYALTLPNAFTGIKFYLVPDFTKINGEVIYTALSQAFFSLSLGLGALITYGSYFGKKDNIISSAALVTTADLSIAFLAGLMIFPLVFFQGIAPSEGPGLVFIALPGIFEAMGPLLGRLVGGAFFLLLCFAALTSTISLLEVPVSYITDEYKANRPKTVWLLAMAIFIIGLPSMLSQGAVPFFTQFITYGGKEHDFMTLIIDLFSDIGLPLGGFLISLFVAYRWRIHRFSEELSEGAPHFKSSWQERFITVMLSVVSPLIIGTIVLATMLDRFFGIALF